jgi:hypothetical protein
MFLATQTRQMFSCASKKWHFLWRAPAMPKSSCRRCGQTFTSLSAFDLHRTGKFQHKMRRCPTEQDMLAKGMVQNAKGWWMRSSFEGELPWTVSDESRDGGSV